MFPPKRVVVTGMGILSPLGVTLDAFWPSLLAGTVGTAQITSFDASRYYSDQGGEVRGFDPRGSFSVLDPDSLQRSTHLAVAAARAAFDDARAEAIDPRRFGVIMGAVVANRPGLEPSVSLRFSRPEQAAAMALEPYDVEWVARAPAIELGLKGPVLSLGNVCAAGNAAIAAAAARITTGAADAMLAGGADELSPAMLMMFSQHRSLSPDVVRPFDRDRRGLLLSEGAAVVVLEAEAHALARGARVYGRVVGSGSFTDAHDMALPHPRGQGAIASMRRALDRAGLAPEDVDYVAAHGTGTPANDGVEAQAIRAVFGAHTDGLPVSSIKSMLGHAQGAAAAMQAVACLLAIRDGAIPPTMNHEVPDPGCPIDVVPNRSRQKRVRAAMSNAFGLGGNTCCVLFTG